MDVYKPEAFEDRVNYAASVISTGRIPSNARHFDTCFEMYDGSYVAAALVRRTLLHPNTQLARHIFRVIDRERAMKSYEETKHLNRKQLGIEAIKHAQAEVARSNAQSSQLGRLEP